MGSLLYDLLDRFSSNYSTIQKIFIFASLYIVIRIAIYLFEYYRVYRKYKIVRLLHKEKLDKSLREIGVIISEN